MPYDPCKKFSSISQPYPILKQNVDFRLFSKISKASHKFAHNFRRAQNFHTVQMFFVLSMYPKLYESARFSRGMTLNIRFHTFFDICATFLDPANFFIYDLMNQYIYLFHLRSNHTTRWGKSTFFY
jgi:hypothetical protein